MGYKNGVTEDFRGLSDLRSLPTTLYRLRIDSRYSDERKLNNILKADFLQDSNVW